MRYWPISRSAEYLIQLCQHIVQGTRGTTFDLPQHIDSCTFWKRAYEASEEAQAKLLDRIFELEQDQETRPKLASAIATASSEVRKRKTQEQDVAVANSRSKRKSIQVERGLSSELDFGMQNGDPQKRKPSTSKGTPLSSVRKRHANMANSTNVTVTGFIQSSSEKLRATLEKSFFVRSRPVPHSNSADKSGRCY